MVSVVVVHCAHGFRFVIYTSDHLPAHVHITGTGHAKINLLGSDGLPTLVYNVGIPRSDMRRLMTEVRLNQSRLLEAWERIHGRVD